MTEKDVAADGCRIFSFRVRMGGKFTGERLSHLNHRQFGISVLLNVFRYFLSNSLFFRFIPSEFFSYAQSTSPKRIRQKNGRIGKASEQHLPVV
jgi:hypothetical protein